MKPSPRTIVSRYLHALQVPSVLLVHGEIDDLGDELVVNVTGVGPMNLPGKPFVTSFTTTPSTHSRHDLSRLLTKALERKGIDPENHHYVFSLDDNYHSEQPDFGGGNSGLQKFMRYLKRHHG